MLKVPENPEQLPLETWLGTDTSTPLGGELLSLTDIAERVYSSGSRVLVLEGCRSSGKSYLADYISKYLNIPVYDALASFGGRKQFLKHKFNGHVSTYEYGFDVATSGLFILDYLYTRLNRSDRRLIFDRGIISNLWYPRAVNTGYVDMYCQLLQSMEGAIIYVRPTYSEEFWGRVHDRGLGEADLKYEISGMDEIAYKLVTGYNVTLWPVSVKGA